MAKDERRAIEGQFAFAQALRSATRVDISASAAGRDSVNALVRVATTADLVVLKLHAVLEPRRPPTKRGSDLYDLLRLLLLHGTAVIAQALATAPEPLRAAVNRNARRVLIDDADRGAAKLRGSSVRGVEVVAADQIESIGRALVDAIEARK